MVKNTALSPRAITVCGGSEVRNGTIGIIYWSLR